MRCKYLVIKDGMMYCGRWFYGLSVEIFDSTCANCPILSLGEGKQCEFLSIDIRAIPNYIGGQRVDVVMSCEKLGKTIQNLRE